MTKTDTNTLARTDGKLAQEEADDLKERIASADLEQRRKALDALAEQAQELGMGYE